MPYNKNDICRACTRHMKFLLYDSAKHVHRENRRFLRCIANGQCEARTSRKSKIFEMYCEEEQCEARTMPCERTVRSTPIEKIKKEAVK